MMRDLVQYPITRAEMVATLRDLAIEAKVRPGGDKGYERAVVILTAAMIIDQAPEDTVTILAEVATEMQVMERA